MDGMENDLTCCVCLEIFVYPLMLPCTHNLCRNCVKGFTRGGSVHKFNCPNCRKEVQLDRIKGVDALPRNLALDNLAYLFRNKAKLSTEKTCGTHDKSLEFYCQTCKSLVCAECVESEHTGFPHRVDAMKKLISEEKNEILDLKEQLSDIEAGVKKNIHTVQRYIRGIKLSEEANIQTVEQSLIQLIAAIHTAKRAFIKKLNQESQKEIDELELLELDYEALLHDIDNLRSQLGVPETTDLIQQYTSYQNAKMKVSGFLAFKLVKVAGPPSSPPIPPPLRLRNTQQVYQAIQALDIKKDPVSPVLEEKKTLESTSRSLPASPKHLTKPSSVHQQNSQEYNSDGEGPSQGCRQTSVSLLVPKDIPESNRPSGAEAEPAPRDASVNPVYVNKDFWVSQPRGAEGQNLTQFPVGNTTVAEAAQSSTVNFQEFSGSFKVAPDNFVPNRSRSESRGISNVRVAEPSLTSPISQPIMSGGGHGQGARPKQYPVSDTHSKQTSANELSDKGDSAFVFSPPRTVPPNHHPPPQEVSSASSVFENQTLFTVGSSPEKSRSRSRVSKNKKKRDLSAGRSHPRL